MSLSKRLLSMLPAIQRVRTAPRKLTSTIRALEPWKYPKSLHQGKNEKNGIAEAIPFLSCLTMFSYREAPFALAFFFSLRHLLAYRAKRGFSLPGSPLLHASSIEARGPRVGQLEKLEGRKASPRKSCLWGYRGKWVPQPCKFRYSRSRMGFRATSKGSRGVHPSRWEPSRR